MPNIRSNNDYGNNGNNNNCDKHETAMITMKSNGNTCNKLRNDCQAKKITSIVSGYMSTKKQGRQVGSFSTKTPVKPSIQCKKNAN